MHKVNAVLDILDAHELAAIAIKAVQVRDAQLAYYRARKQASPTVGVGDLLTTAMEAEQELDALLAPIREAAK